MARVPHIPLLRSGRPYRSLEVRPLRDVVGGEVIAEASQASPGMISRDLRDMDQACEALGGLTVGRLLEICREAGRRFAEDELPLGEDRQGPEDYVRQLSATTAMPQSMVRSNVGKIVGALEGMEAVLGGLTRGLDLEILDQGWGEQDGRRMSYLRQSRSLGAVLPNNSPGVHTLWLPSIPLKVPLVLRPGSAEPWTPLRIAEALFASGCPRQAISFYPSGHAGGNQILLGSERSMIFGDQSTVERWQRDLRVQAHGPGWSKILLDQESSENWPSYLVLLAASVGANGGRSCINASGVWASNHGLELAQGLATRLASVPARGLEDPEAELAGFSDPEIARRLSQMIDDQLEIPGARDLTAELRSGGRVVEVEGCTFLVPTVIWCEDPQHPLAQAEFGFPFVSVVQVPESQLFESIGPTLVATVISDKPALREQALTCAHVDRLNFGPIPTHQIAWDQPHEGNLFDHLYRQRAFQAA
ncbi:MAG: aldehyde dehydrogenase [Deltaproteobacteria bacterium]|nr:aldehyde dehydrogenase [Deltaproteobacteria bacterium]